MGISIYKVTDELLNALKEHPFEPLDNEGAVFIKLVALKPSTINSGKSAEVIETAASAILIGKLDDIQEQFNTWFNDLKGAYVKETT